MRDDGVGMTPEMLARAFDLFVQGDPLSRSSPGRPGHRPHPGADAGRDARRIGASVQRGPGRGSELVVRLPLRRRREAARGPRRRRRAEGGRSRCACSSSTTTSTPRRRLGRLLRFPRPRGRHWRTTARRPSRRPRRAAGPGADRHRAAGHGRLRGRGAAARRRPRTRDAGGRHRVRPGGRRASARAMPASTITWSSPSSSRSSRRSPPTCAEAAGRQQREERRPAARAGRVTPAMRGALSTSRWAARTVRAPVAASRPWCHRS